MKCYICSTVLYGAAETWTVQRVVYT